MTDFLKNVGVGLSAMLIGAVCIALMMIAMKFDAGRVIVTAISVPMILFLSHEIGKSVRRS